ncbi:hypothetical protein ACWJJH_02220 [Endozoicomonadaceae bacterium StTr2]
MRLTRLAAQMSSTVGDVPCIKGFGNTLLIAGLFTLAAVQPLQAEIGRIIEYQFDFSTPVGQENSYKHYSVASPTPVPFLEALISSVVDDHMTPVKGFENRVIYDGMTLDLELEVAEDGYYEITVFAQDEDDDSYDKGFISSVRVTATDGAISTCIDLSQHTYPMAGVNCMYRISLHKVPVTPDEHISQVADMQVLVFDNIPDRIRGAAIIDLSIPADFAQQAPLCQGHYLSKLYIAANTSRIKNGLPENMPPEDQIRNYGLVLVKGSGLNIYLPPRAIRLSEAEIDRLIIKTGLKPEVQQHLFHFTPTRFWTTLEQDLTSEQGRSDYDWFREGDQILWHKKMLEVPLIERWEEESGPVASCGLFSVSHGFNTLLRPEVQYLPNVELMASGWDEDVCLCLAKDSEDGFNKMRLREDRGYYEVLNSAPHLTEIFKLRNPQYRSQPEIRICHLPNPEIKHLTLVDVGKGFSAKMLTERWQQIQRDYAASGTLVIIVSETPERVRKALSSAGCHYHLIMRPTDYFKAFNHDDLCGFSFLNLVYYNRENQSLRGNDVFHQLSHTEYQLGYSDAGIH